MWDESIIPNAFDTTDATPITLLWARCSFSISAGNRYANRHLAPAALKEAMQHAIAYGVIHEPKITIGIQALHFWPGSSCWKPWIIHINWFDIVKNDTEDGYLRTSPFDAHIVGPFLSDYCQ